jgi:hypothetical protein
VKRAHLKACWHRHSFTPMHQSGIDSWILTSPTDDKQNPLKNRPAKNSPTCE